MATEYKYDVFISYSRKDYVDEATKEKIPNNVISIIKKSFDDNGITYWIDEDGIYVGDKYMIKIADAIADSSILLFVSSSNSNASEWTPGEIGTAHLYKKKIIPFRIDDTPYARSIIVKIASLNYIDFFGNNKKAITELVSAVKAYKDELEERKRKKEEEAKQKQKEEEQRKEIERKKNEDAKRRKEEEEQQRKEQQKQLIEDIRTSVKELNIEETKLDLERNKLLVKTDKVIDMAQRESLKTEITESSPLRKKSQTEIKKLQEQVAELKTECDSFEEKKKAFLKELADKNSENASLRKEVDSKRQEPIESKTSNNKWMHFVYGLVFGFMLIMIPAICVRSCVKHLPGPNHTNDSINLAQETVVVDSVLEFLVDNIKFKMIKVEGGTFMLGAQKTDPSGQNFDGEAWDDEKPVHKVTLSSFYMGEVVVTQALWKAVMGSEPTAYGGWESQYGKGNDYPAYRVSYNDIVNDFLPKLNRLTGKNFRLPTEAEWEYAARGGKKSRGYKYSGSNILGDVGWYVDNSGSSTHPVKGKKLNELGLYDMSGNVWEWCQDWKNSYSSSEQTNPTGPSTGSGCVLRGGSWNYGARYCRVSDRSDRGPGSRSLIIGFRLVLPQ